MTQVFASPEPINTIVTKVNKFTVMNRIVKRWLKFGKSSIDVSLFLVNQMNHIAFIQFSNASSDVFICFCWTTRIDSPEPINTLESNSKSTDSVWFVVNTSTLIGFGEWFLLFDSLEQIAWFCKVNQINRKIVTLLFDSPEPINICSNESNSKTLIQFSK